MAGGPDYEVIEGWEQLPSGARHRDVAGVAVDSADRLFVLGRGDAQVLVYEADGTFVRAFGKGAFTERTHGLTIGPDDAVYAVDDGDHTVRKFTADGELVMTIGTVGKASDTGYKASEGLASIKRAGPPFNRPTGIVVSPSGELYVSDGYGNACVHRFTAGGELIGSWGGPGNGPGQFNLPHGVAIDQKGRILVADRENDRIQIFDADGGYLDEWKHVQRPTDIAVDADGWIYVACLWWRVGQESLVHGPVRHDLPGHISILDPEGNLLHRRISADRCAPGNFVAPHTIAVDSHGDIYVGEVTYTFGVAAGDIPADCHTLQKFRRI
jgi:DNA-binding beta-propeller fold protein YncE